MEYSNVTNKNGLLQDCEFFTNLGDAGITGDALLKAQFTSRLNNWYQTAVTLIIDANDGFDFDDPNHTDYPILTTPFVAGQRDYTIPLSEKVLKLKRMDVTFNGNDYYKAEPFDINESGLGFGNDTITDGRFSKTEPMYDPQYNSYFVYPLASQADVDSGAEMIVQWVREVIEFVVGDTTQEPGIDEPFHRFLSIGASYDWLLVNKPEQTALITRLESMIADYRERIKEHYGWKNQDRNYVLKTSVNMLDYE